MSACRHCGWELPPGALFCGECGRAVSAPAAVSVEAVLPDDAGRPPEPVPPEGRGPDAVPVGPAERPPTAAPLTSFGREWDSWTSSSWDDAAATVRVTDPAAVVDLFEPTSPVRDPASVARPPARPPVSDPRPPAAPLLPVPDVSDAGSSRPVVHAAPEGTAIDLESTRLVSRTPQVRYVLQFSTGESVTVTGSGLVGRNPGMEPGEFVDQLVTLVDGGRSVSKTHLEFGQEQGRFWISDRYSTNGTVVRAPDEPERRCEPGRRYLVSRGTRVDIGEQFFVVS